jgi:PAS domain S-box-containing protein
MTDEDPQESERRYQQLIRTSPAPINIFDGTGEILWGNDAVLDLLGLETRSELIGRSIFEFISVDDEETARRELAAVVEDKESTGPTQMTLERVDGERRRIRVATAPGRYDGTDIGQAVVLDLTALEETRAELAAERRFIDEALDALEDVFYVLDPDGQLERWNDALLETTGYAASAVESMSIESFFVDRHRDRVAESVATALADGTDVLEATVRTKHGTEIPYEFRKRRLTTEGDVTGVVGIGRDVSVRDARDQHLRAVDHLLRHNLRNQLTIIQGTLDTIREGDSAIDAAHVDRIDAATDQLLSIFDNHEEIVSTLTASSDLDSLDAVSIVESVVADARDRYPAAAIHASVPGSATVMAVPVLSRAVAELVENAIEHNPGDAPVVRVTVDASDTTVSIAVADDGPLIPEMEYTNLSDADGIGPTSHPGGLGLWFVYLVAQRSGGKLRFDENDPEGNVVTLELPRARSGEAS